MSAHMESVKASKRSHFLLRSPRSAAGARALEVFNPVVASKDYPDKACSMVLSAWNSGTTYGLRFGVYQTLIDGKAITLKLEGGPTIELKVTDAFWRKCPEFRHPEIREWFKRQGLRLPWPSGKPYKFPFTRVRRDVFHVSYAQR